MTKLSVDAPVRMISLVLMTDPGLAFVKRVEVPWSERTDRKCPGVVIFEERAFMFAYQENPTSFVYRETVAVQVTE